MDGLLTGLLSCMESCGQFKFIKMCNLLLNFGWASNFGNLANITLNFILFLLLTIYLLKLSYTIC